MTPQTAAKLLEINRTFYENFATAWDDTRQQPWPSFGRIASTIAPCNAFLDVGCGNGRLGRYLLDQGAIQRYVGVDNSAGLLTAAKKLTGSDVHQRDLAAADALEGLETFDAMACLAAMHHIPGEARRVQLLQQMSDHLKPGGVLFLSNFQFLANLRMEKKVLAWSVAGIDSAEVEPNDYLLSWHRGGEGTRYLNLVDEDATERMVAQTDLTLVEMFRSDGKEGNLNLYVILEK